MITDCKYYYNLAMLARLSNGSYNRSIMTHISNDSPSPSPRSGEALGDRAVALRAAFLSDIAATLERSAKYIQSQPEEYYVPALGSRAEILGSLLSGAGIIKKAIEFNGSSSTVQKSTD